MESAGDRSPRPYREIEMGTHVNLMDNHDLSLSRVYYGEAPPLTIYDLNNADQRVTKLFFQQLKEDIDDISSRYERIFAESLDDWAPEPDPETHVHNLTQKALNGNHNAMLKLAQLYHHGQNYSEAEKWYQEALKYGHPQASVSLGRLYLNMGHEESAKRLFLAEAEHPKALYLLGQMYTDEQQYDKAFFYTLRAAAYQDADAINHLGILRVLGLGTEKNEKEARKNFLHAMKNKQKKAMNNYALMLYLGQKGKANLDSAYHLFNESAGYGIAAGYYHLGLMYEKGKGVEKHEETAEDCYLAAAKLGSPIAMHRIGCWHRDRDKTEEALSWWKKAAQKNHAQSCFELWKHLKTIDLKKGLEYLNLSKELDDRFEMKKGLTLEDGLLYWIE